MWQGGAEWEHKYTEGVIGKSDQVVRWILQHPKASDITLYRKWSFSSVLHHHGALVCHKRIHHNEPSKCSDWHQLHPSSGFLKQGRLPHYAVLSFTSRMSVPLTLPPVVGVWLEQRSLFSWGGQEDLAAAQAGLHHQRPVFPSWQVPFRIPLGFGDVCLPDRGSLGSWGERPIHLGPFHPLLYQC